MKSIIHDLKEARDNTNILRRLNNFIIKNPDHDWKQYFGTENEQLLQKVTSDLESFKKFELAASAGIVSNNSSNKLDEFNKRMNKLANQRTRFHQ